MAEDIGKVHSSTPITSEADVKPVRTNETSDPFSSEFDGTANLTLGGGTILIPAPTADPRGMTPSTLYETRGQAL